MSEWDIVEDNHGNAVIKVIGVGGGGGNRRFGQVDADLPAQALARVAGVEGVFQRVELLRPRQERYAPG